MKLIYNDNVILIDAPSQPLGVEIASTATTTGYFSPYNTNPTSNGILQQLD